MNRQPIDARSGETACGLDPKGESGGDAKRQAQNTGTVDLEKRLEALLAELLREPNGLRKNALTIAFAGIAAEAVPLLLTQLREYRTALEHIKRTAQRHTNTRDPDHRLFAVAMYRATGKAIGRGTALEARPAMPGAADALIVGLRERIDGVVEFQGHGFWTTCTGCYESEDGHPNGDYPQSDVLGCALGGGCSECGGIGAVWDDTDYDALIADRDDWRQQQDIAALTGDVREAAPEREASKRYLSDRFEYAAPGDQQEDAWLVRFCDKDVREQIWTGPDAEAEAWAAWEQYAPSYNIYVFRLARLASPPSAHDMREALESLLPTKLCGESWELPDNETVTITVTFGQLRAARAALASSPMDVVKAAVEAEWQPIETCEAWRTDHLRTVLAYWTARGVCETYWDEDVDFDSRPKGWPSPRAGWRSPGDHCIPVNQGDVTHWCPLPAPPAIRARAGDAK